MKSNPTPGDPWRAGPNPKQPAFSLVFVLLTSCIFVASSARAQVSLQAPNADPDDGFGAPVAMDGNVAVVGAVGESSANVSDPTDNSAPVAGAAYVYVRTEGAWQLSQYLKASDAAPEGYFGSSLAVSDNLIAVGAPRTAPDPESGISSGAVYLFERTSTGWEETAILHPSIASDQQRFGASIAIHGDILAVGAPRTDSEFEDSGAVFLFQRVPTDGGGGGESHWQEIQMVEAQEPRSNARFGLELALGENQLAVGGQDRRVHLFELAPATARWIHSQILNDPITSLITTTNFGESLALKNDRLAVGAKRSEVDVSSPINPRPPVELGAAYLYKRDGGGQWVLEQTLMPSSATPETFFGHSVLLGEDSLFVSAPLGGMGGTVYRYPFNDEGVNTLEIVPLQMPEATSSDFFGSDLASSGGTLMVGSTRDLDQLDPSLHWDGTAFLFTNFRSPVFLIQKISHQKNSIALSLFPRPGRTIGIEYSANLASSTWIDLGNAIAEEDGIPKFVDPDSERVQRPMGFYRAFLRP